MLSLRPIGPVIGVSLSNTDIATDIGYINTPLHDSILRHSILVKMKFVIF